MHCELQPRTKEHAGSRRLTQVHRRGLPLHEAERWLAPVLDYDPE